ncbi:MAG TPA: helix-hairpin-helix domain-containing protein [Caldilineaceae bacterium]|nr:helix-hairpin-helix domain-containing protein [Caldilineaceae bacterium]
MQTLETLKTKGKARFASVMDVAKDQPSDLKHWGVAAGSAVVGAVAVNAAARGMVAILAVMASPPIALTLGAVGGGYLGWSYLQKRQAAAQGADESTVEPVVETIPVSAADSPTAPEITPPIADPVVAESTVLETAPSIVPDDADATPAVADDLEAINGIGPVYAGKLHSAGIQTFAQLAELSADQVRALIGPLRSGHMIEPDKWIAEAQQFVADGSGQ